MNVDEDTLRRIMREETQRIVRKETKHAVREGIKSAGIVTREELNPELDNRFAGFEANMDSRFAGFEANMDSRFADFETKLARFFGQTHRYFDKRFDKFEKKFDKKFDCLCNSVDGVVKRLDDDDTERAAMSSQLDRHETNINKLARHTGATLSLP